MTQKSVNGGSLGDAFHAEIPEERSLTRTAPGTRKKIRKFRGRIQMIPEAVENEAHLVYVVAVKLSAEDHVRKDGPDGNPLRIPSLTAHVLPNGVFGALLEMFAREKRLSARRLIYGIEIT